MKVWLNKFRGALYDIYKNLRYIFEFYLFFSFFFNQIRNILSLLLNLRILIFVLSLRNSHYHKLLHFLLIIFFKKNFWNEILIKMCQHEKCCFLKLTKSRVDQKEETILADLIVDINGTTHNGICKVQKHLFLLDINLQSIIT
jgi:hypothetical protein